MQQIDDLVGLSLRGLHARTAIGAVLLPCAEFVAGAVLWNGFSLIFTDLPLVFLSFTEILQSSIQWFLSMFVLSCFPWCSFTDRCMDGCTDGRMDG